MAAGPIHSSARRFDDVADLYERVRPGYPAGAVDWLVRQMRLTPGQTVLDLAAGTGKLTRLLAARRLRVVAVEPLAAMRAKLAASVAEIEVRDGTADAIPLPDRSVDGVTVAQAFHWFARTDVVAEIHRVLRPGRSVGLVWNRRDTTDALQARLDEVLDRYRGDTPAHGEATWRLPFAATSLFTQFESREFPHEQVLDATGLLERVASISFVAALPEEARREALGAVAALVVDHPPEFSFPYVTEVHVSARR